MEDPSLISALVNITLNIFIFIKLNKFDEKHFLSLLLKLNFGQLKKLGLKAQKIYFIT